MIIFNYKKLLKDDEQINQIRKGEYSSKSSTQAMETNRSCSNKKSYSFSNEMPNSKTISKEDHYVYQLQRK